MHTLPALIDAQAARLDRKAAYSLVGSQGLQPVDAWSYADLQRRCRTIAAQLVTFAPEGARVVLLYPTGLDFIGALFGSMYAGLTPVPLYPPDPARTAESLGHLARVIRDCDACGVLCDPTLMFHKAQFDLLAPDLAGRAWFVLDPEGPDVWSGAAPSNPDALALLQYTSGSTGAPKGVMLTQGNLLANQAEIHRLMGSDRDTVMVSWLPLYHDMGLIGCAMQPLFVGGECWLNSPQNFIRRPLDWLKLISARGGTISGAPNFAFELCAKRANALTEPLDLSRWRVAFNGSEPVRAGTLRRFFEAFAPHGLRREALFPCYGMAEASLIISGGHWGGEAHRVEGPALVDGGVAPTTSQDPIELTSTGRVGESFEVVVADPETGARRPEAALGEIWIRGPSVAQGYWGRDSEAFHAGLDNGAGGEWFRTGDVGFLRDGELFVTGRLKDMIIVAGRKYSSEDFEQSIREADPRFLQGLGCAFALPDERIAFLQEIRTSRIDEMEELAAIVRRQISVRHGCRVSLVAFCSRQTIPRTLNGKVRRSETARLYAGGALTLTHSVATQLVTEVA
jgi:acyl-CoA synthetase (AMP-forming)/AMP-acid ligase II